MALNTRNWVLFCDFGHPYAYAGCHMRMRVSYAYGAAKTCTIGVSYAYRVYVGRSYVWGQVIRVWGQAIRVWVETCIFQILYTYDQVDTRMGIQFLINLWCLH